MKTKYYAGVILYPYKELLLIEVSRAVKNSQPIKVEKRYYKYDYKSDHIYTAFSRAIKLMKIQYDMMFRELRK